MQTHSVRLFEKDNISTLTTSIVSIIEQQVKIVRDGKPLIDNLLGIVLSETILHPQGGGQPSDKGQLNDLEVVAVRENKDELSEQGLPTIYHFIDPKTTAYFQPTIQQNVELTLDVEFRKQCTRSHTAGHLIADVIEHDPKFSSLQVQSTQGHHFPGSEYIKVLAATQPSNLEELCHQLNMSIANLIAANNLPVTAFHQNGIRYIKIGDFARMCGGTHVKAIYELEGIKVTKARAKSGVEGKTELTIFYNA
jgi:alanyl-tRNA synthetase